MIVTVDDKSDGSQFDLDLSGGEPAAGTLLVTEASDGSDRRVYLIVKVAGSALTVERQRVSHGVMATRQPPMRPPTAAPVVAYGNNASVVCPCGVIVMVRSLGKGSGGAFKCGCGRYLKGFPDEGARVEEIHVWEPGDESALGTYRVAVDRSLHQA